MHLHLRLNLRLLGLLVRLRHDRHKKGYALGLNSRRHGITVPFGIYQVQKGNVNVSVVKANRKQD